MCVCEKVGERDVIASSHSRRHEVDRYKHISGDWYAGMQCTLTCSERTPRNSSETCAGAFASGGQKGCRRWNNWLVLTCDAASTWERDWQEHLKSGWYQFGLSSKNVFRHGGHAISGMTHGDEFVVAGLTARLIDLKNKIAGVYPIVTKNHQPCFNGRHQHIEQNNFIGGREEWCVSTIPDKSTC